MQCASQCISNENCTVFSYESSSQVCEFGFKGYTIPSTNLANSKAIYSFPGKYGTCLDKKQTTKTFNNILFYRKLYFWFRKPLMF
jgi:hypothetical protein